VVDEMARGVVDEDEEADAAPADRAYWERRASKATVAIADELFQIVKQLDGGLELKYNKFYIGLARDGQPFNFVYFQPRKNQLNLYLKLPETDEINAKIDNSGIARQEYDKRSNRYRLLLTKGDSSGKPDVLHELIKLAHEQRFG
jgi:predicted transport protein